MEASPGNKVVAERKTTLTTKRRLKFRNREYTPIDANRYRPEKTLQHCRTLQALPLILGPERKADADYLDACRIKRNTVEYDYAGAAIRKDTKELIEFTRELRAAVIAWLEREHIELTLPEDKQ